MDPVPNNHDSGTLPLLFRSVFWVRIALLGAALLANIALLAGTVDLTVGVVVFVVLVVGYTILSLIAWRCPHCDKYPGSSVMPDFCEKCGRRLFGIDKPTETAARMTSPPEGTRKNILPLVFSRAAYGVVVFAVFAYVGLKAGDLPAILWILTGIFMALSAWLEWKWWRCPHCNGSLKRSLWPGRNCAKCGGTLL